MTVTLNPTMGIKEWPPFSVVLGRGGLAAIALISYVSLSGGQMPASLRLWGEFLVMGVLTSLFPHSLIVWGQGGIDSGLASILVSTTPLFSVVLAHFLTSEERMTPNRLVGVLLGLGGVVVLIGPQALEGLGRPGLRQLAVVGAAFSYACAGIYGRRFKGLSPVVAAAGQLTGTVLLVLPLALALEQPWSLRPSPVTWGAMLGLALLSTAVAFLIFFRILAVAGATNVMLVNFLVPISALLLGMLILGERPDWAVFAGLGLIFTGLVSVDGRLLSPWDRQAWRIAPPHSSPRGQ